MVLNRSSLIEGMKKIDRWQIRKMAKKNKWHSTKVKTLQCKNSTATQILVIFNVDVQVNRVKELVVHICCKLTSNQNCSKEKLS